MKLFSILFLLIICFGYSGCKKKSLDADPDIRRGLTIATNYIEGFRSSSSRLPSREEFFVWWKTNVNNLGGGYDYQIAQKETNEYVLFIWDGNKIVKYSSKGRTMGSQ